MKNGQLRKLPLVLVGFNAIVSIVAFGLAIIDPVRSGLLPIVVFGMDFPASLAILQLTSFWDSSHRVRVSLCIDGMIFTVFGAIWFYFLGLMILKFLTWLTRKKVTIH